MKLFPLVHAVLWLSSSALMTACGSSSDSPAETGGVTLGAGGSNSVGGPNSVGGADVAMGGSSGGARPIEASVESSSGTGTSRDASADAARSSGSDASTAGRDAAQGTLNDAAASRVCKRGIAANIAPSAAFSAGVGWWYNWAATTSAPDNGVSFVPMAWDEASVNAAFPAGSPFILGFNEPNFKAQANLTAEQAAAQWKTLQNNARAVGVPLVSPAVNFCGPAANCNGTDPYAYLKAFFAACNDCRVDYVAVHWYNCDVASLRDYLEPGGSLEGFEQFNRPIWLTEFACSIGGDSSVAGQEAYMRAAIPYLESNPHVFRYSWFSATPIPNARLVNDDGSPTALGLTYIGLDGDCHH
jgi:hypothetical protein